MNSQVKAQWIAALRSGQYRQGIGALRHDDAYCCLGVLCDVHRKATNDGYWGDVYGMTAYRTSTDSDGTILPYPVRVWAGLYNNDPMVNGLSLSQYNDGEDGGQDECGVYPARPPATFNAIADLIEKHL